MRSAGNEQKQVGAQVTNEEVNYKMMPFLTFEEVYKKYFEGHIGRSKLRSMVRQKQIPTVNLPGRIQFFSEEVLDNWFKEIAEPDTSEPLPKDYGRLRELK